MRNAELVSDSTKSKYLEDYAEAAGIQNFLNAKQNYAELKGSQTNLFKCFLPQSWMYGSYDGVAAFIHPDGVFDDPNGGELRKKLYPRLIKHFQFINEKKLFAEVHHNTIFSLNVYCNKFSDKFQVIANLFDANTIDECYDNSVDGLLPGIKDEEGKWNLKGHPGRIVNVGKLELQLFAKLFDASDEWKMARLPAIHAQKLLEVLKLFAKCKVTLNQIEEDVYLTEMWHETNSQLNGTIMRNVHIPEMKIDTIYSGPHIGVSNPLFKASRRVCKLNSDYDNIDLTSINSEYLQRCNYSVSCSADEYVLRRSITNWDTTSHSDYNIFARKMLNLSGERTLISAIVPADITHINGILGIDFRKIDDMIIVATFFSSIPYDFFIRTLGKSNLYTDNAGKLPIIHSKYDKALALRGLLLNSLNLYYKELWKDAFDNVFKEEQWGKEDERLLNSKFELLSNEWKWNTPVRTDYERRELLVEIDVLTAMALYMTLEQLKMIYHIQFPVLQSYESDTWYDQNGRIVFTNNRSLTGVGYSRQEWEVIKDVKAGMFTRVLVDDTVPDGPLERRIEYIAPFDRCDREKDYEEIWSNFEERFREK